jgi:hypothetical protein
MLSCNQAAPPNEPETVDPDAFGKEVGELCKEAAVQYDILLDAKTKLDLKVETEQLSEAERELAANLARLEAPPELEDRFAEYIATLQTSTDEADESLKRKKPGAVFAASLGHAELLLKLHRISGDLQLAIDCPPPPSLNVYNTLFTARGNKACFEIGKWATNKLGPAPQVASRADAERLFGVLSTMTSRAAKSLRAALHPKVTFAPMRRLVRIYERRAPLIAEIHRAFVSVDEPAYFSATRKAKRVERKSRALALRVGLFQCASLVVTGFE